MQTPIRVFDDRCFLLGEADGYESFLFTRKNSGFGEFTICLNASLPGADLFWPGNIVYLDTARAGFVEAVEIESAASGESCENMTVTGRTLEFLLAHRLTLPLQSAPPQNAAQLIKALVTRNLGSGAESERRVSNFTVSAGGSIPGDYTWEWGYKNLAEEVSRICEATGLGVRVYLDLEQKRFVFDVARGTDRTLSQTDCPPVILSAEYDNVFEQTFIVSRLEEKNTALAAGEGEGQSQAVRWVNGENTGICRRELFAENRSLSGTDSAALELLGSTALSNTGPVESLDCVVNPFHTFALDRDFFLGDFVTLKWRGREYEKQVTEITESWDANEYGISCVFGKRAPTLLDKING